MLEVQSAAITGGLSCVDSSKIIGPDNKDPELFSEFTRVIHDATMRHGDDVQGVEIGAKSYVGIQLALARRVNGELLHATVQGRVHDYAGEPIGIANTNPLLDSMNSRQYEV